MKCKTRAEKIWTIEDLLSPQHCDDLVTYGEGIGFKPAAVRLPQGAIMMKGLRNNDRVKFEDKSLAHSLFSSIKEFLPVIDCNFAGQSIYEQFRIYRYDKAQRFKRHIDGRERCEGRESRLSFLVYLNDDFTGGQTQFDDVTISPQKGSALLFVHEQKHESLPIESGTKYVLRSDIFYAERENI